MLHCGRTRFAIRSRSGSCSQFLGTVVSHSVTQSVKCSMTLHLQCDSHCKCSVMLHIVSRTSGANTKISTCDMIKLLQRELQPARGHYRLLFITRYRRLRYKDPGRVHKPSRGGGAWREAVHLSLQEQLHALEGGTL